jgi:D-ribulokinase
MTAEDVFLGVDVGTGSARAGLFTAKGQMVATASHPIRFWRDGETIVEQSSADIWQAVCAAVSRTIRLSGATADRVKGIGFDATCSLVVVGPGDAPLSASLSGDRARDVIVWMDHRAKDQARRINDTGGAPLAYVGDCISPEMQMPKLLWLKENLPDSYARATAFMDLTDYLTWRATGSAVRSSCTLTCKWTYLPHQGGWDAGFLGQIGLGDLAQDGFLRIGTNVAAPGTPLGQGLSPAAAADLGLLPRTPVGAGLIDAHAGGLGSLPVGREGDTVVDTQVAYVFGTSACLMASSTARRHVRGVWGPYWSAMLPDAWLLEGGQSAAGSAIDYVLRAHPASAAAREAASAAGLTLLPWLERRILARHPGISAAASEVARMHSILDFAGIRSPDADPTARGVLTGISLSDDLLSLEQTYVAAVLGVAYGARQILSALAVAGSRVGQIVISGGAAKSALVRQLLADATGLPVAQAKTPEPVLLGASMLGAVAAGAKASLPIARHDMVFLDSVAQPDPDMAMFHRWKFGAYRTLQQTERQLWAAFDAEAGDSNRTRVSGLEG